MTSACQIHVPRRNRGMGPWPGHVETQHTRSRTRTEGAQTSTL